MSVIFKILNVRSMVVYIEWKTTDSELNIIRLITRLILSLTFLERPL